MQYITNSQRGRILNKTQVISCVLFDEHAKHIRRSEKIKLSFLILLSIK